MTGDQAGWVSMEEFEMRLDGYRKKQQQEWERARWIAFNFMSLSPFLKNPPRTLHEFAPFEWDEKPQAHFENAKTTVTEADKNELSKIIKAYKNSK